MNDIPFTELTSILSEPARRFFAEAEDVLGCSDFALSRYRWGGTHIDFSTVLQTVQQLTEHQEGVLDLLRRTKELPEEVWIPVHMNSLYQNVATVIPIAQDKEKRDAVIHLLHTLAEQQLGDPLVCNWKWLANPSLETLEGIAALAAHEELTLDALNIFRNGIGRPLHLYHVDPMSSFGSGKEGILYHADGFLKIAPEAAAIVQALDARYKGEHSFSRFEQLAREPENILALTRNRPQIDAFRKMQFANYQGWGHEELRDAVPLAELATNLNVVRLMQGLQQYRGKYLESSGISLQNLYANGMGASLNNEGMVKFAAHAEEVIHFARVVKERLGAYVQLSTLLHDAEAGLRLICEADIIESFAASLQAAGYMFPNKDVTTFTNMYGQKTLDRVRNAIRHSGPFVGIVSAMHQDGYTLCPHFFDSLVAGATVVYDAMQKHPFTIGEVTPKIIGQLTPFNKKQYSITHLITAVEAASACIATAVE